MKQLVIRLLVLLTLTARHGLRRLAVAVLASTGTTGGSRCRWWSPRPTPDRRLAVRPHHVAAQGARRAAACRPGRHRRRLHHHLQRAGRAGARHRARPPSASRTRTRRGSSTTATGPRCARPPSGSASATSPAAPTGRTRPRHAKAGNLNNALFQTARRVHADPRRRPGPRPRDPRPHARASSATRRWRWSRRRSGSPTSPSPTRSAARPRCSTGRSSRARTAGTPPSSAAPTPSCAARRSCSSASSATSGEVERACARALRRRPRRRRAGREAPRARTRRGRRRSTSVEDAVGRGPRAGSAPATPLSEVTYEFQQRVDAATALGWSPTTSRAIQADLAEHRRARTCRPHDDELGLPSSTRPRSTGWPTATGRRSGRWSRCRRWCAPSTSTAATRRSR